MVFHLVLTTQAVTLHVHLALGEVQFVFPRESFAYFYITHIIVAVTDCVPVIVHPVGHDMQMLVFPVGMAAHNVLGVRYTHAPHILTGDFDHQVICQLGCVLVCEVQ